MIQTLQKKFVFTAMTAECLRAAAASGSAATRVKSS